MSYARERLGRAVKRAVDVAGSAVGIALLSPVLAGAAVAVAATMGRPILFTQQRAGRGGEPFRIFKFRTMRAPRRDEAMYHSDSDRLTRLGRFLRKTSIDELPELFNVLIGDMSLVGPRPLLLEYVPKYDARQRRRLDVLPGITGWAQVNGRQTIKFSKRLELDAWYVDNWSLWLDAKILFMTVAGVLQGGDDVLPGQSPLEVDDVGFFTSKPATNGAAAGGG